MKCERGLSTKSWSTGGCSYVESSLYACQSPPLFDLCTPISLNGGGAGQTIVLGLPTLGGSD